MIMCWYKIYGSLSQNSKTAEHIAMDYYEVQKNNGLKNFQTKKWGRSSWGTSMHTGPNVSYHCGSLLNREQHMLVYWLKEATVHHLMISYTPFQTIQHWLLLDSGQ